MRRIKAGRSSEVFDVHYRQLVFIARDNAFFYAVVQRSTLMNWPVVWGYIWLKIDLKRFFAKEGVPE